LVADDGQLLAMVAKATVVENDVFGNEFDPKIWSAKFDSVMTAGVKTGEWAGAAELITELWRELQDSRVPEVDYTLLAGFIEKSEVESSIRKYLALTLVEKSLAEQNISTALADLASYRQLLPEHNAALLANIGIINLHFKNDLAAAENVLAQLHTLAAQNDVAAAEEEKKLATMIDNYRQHFDAAAMSLLKPAAVAVIKIEEREGSLLENYPNPFLSRAKSRLAGNPETMIRYRVNGQNAQEVSLIILTTLGQRVRTLVAARQEPGSYSVSWDGRDDFGKEMASGMYFLRAEIGAQTLTRKLLLLR
jgi:hypothetical protein